MQRLRTFIRLSILLLGGAVRLYGQSIPGYVIPDSLRALARADSSDLAPSFGGYVSVDPTFHPSDFQSLPGAPSCCPQFTTGTGTGFSAGVIYAYPMAGGLILAGRVDYESISARFRDREATTFIVHGKATPGAFEHRLDAHYGAIMLQPMAGYRLFDNLLGRNDIIGYLGFGIGMKTGSDFTQEEAIVEPAGIGVYTETGTDTRNQYSGSIPEATTMMADVRAGIGGDVPLNSAGTFLLSPEVWYSYGLTPVVHSVSWRVNELRFGLAFRYRPGAAIVR